MISHMQYGYIGLDINLPFKHVTELRPQFVIGLADEQAGFETAVRSPINRPPLAEIIGAQDTVAVVIADITRMGQIMITGVVRDDHDGASNGPHGVDWSGSPRPAVLDTCDNTCNCRVYHHVLFQSASKVGPFLVPVLTVADVARHSIRWAIL